MSAPMLPAMHLSSTDGMQEFVALDLPSSSKFSVSYASTSRQNMMASHHERRSSFSSSEGEMLSLEGEPLEGDNSGDIYRTEEPSTPLLGYGSDLPNTQDDDLLKPSSLLSRRYSMPLPSQLAQLQHPHRPGPSLPVRSDSYFSSAQSAQVHELSVELADASQMIIQTMLQISPPQVLDPTKEQLSACSLSVPTSSISAIFTAMKNINYISANMSAFCSEPMSPRAAEKSPARLSPPILNEFDIGETLQCVGDVLSGAAAEAGVDLVIYHGDVSLKHIYVLGDESAISYALCHIVRQVLHTAQRGDSIELGLLVTPVNTHPDPPNVVSLDDEQLRDLPSLAGSAFQFTIRISHKYGPSELDQGTSRSNTSESPTRPRASFSAQLLHQILDQIDGTLEPELLIPESLTSGRTCDLRFTLQSVASPPRTPIQEFGTESGGSPEPSIELLTTFVESLKGKKTTLYASSKRSFAQHLTSYLTAWGMDVSHVSPDGNVDGVTDSPISPPPAKNQTPQVLSAYHANAEGTLGSGVLFNAESTQPLTESPLFILIDDNVDILKERLQALRIEQNQPSSYRNPRKRPSLAANHRPRSSPHLARLLGQNTTLRQPVPATIMMFASLSKYKLLKDVMQSIVTSYTASSIPLPEVMIIPKPAGPRRCLTALHTAVTKPTVDSSFIPIATSPTSPGVNTRTSFFSSRHNSVSSNPPASPSSTTSTTKSRPVGSRSDSDRSTRSTKDILEQPSNLPPSPLALPDNVEYFSAAAQKLGTSPSSGLVIQSPDGQPAGIYFHPRSKGSRNPSSQLMERDKGQLGVPPPRKASASRLTPNSFGEAVVSFSSLHAAMSPKTTSSESGEGGLSQSISSLNVQIPDRQPTPPSSMPSLASSILAPVPRRPSESNRNLSPPPQSPYPEGTPSRRSYNKRPSPQDKDSFNKKGKAPADGNIVPPISVLIVDDNPINQTILSTFMKKKKITYQLASNGQEAVEKWRTGQFHLILMDIQMPVMDGIQATKEIRRLEKSNAASGYPPNLTPSTETEGQRTPSESSVSATSSESRPPASPYRSSVIIVALTASSLQSDRVAALAAGCNDFLTKPVSLLWLNNKIIEWGSIKALQMWADVRPDAMRNMNTGQAAQARNVAERLNIPKGRATPSPSRLQENAAAIALASPAGSSIIPSFVPGGLSGTCTDNSTPTCPPNESFRASFDSPLETALTDLSKVQPFTRRFSDIADHTPTQSSVKTDATRSSSSDSLTPTATLPETLSNDGEEIRENGHAGALRPRPPDRDTSVNKVPLP
ncbi:uncharacterized protein LACBIDRAFT_303735 [Laccaria bicolor S238N-H82]|uniref:Predicted protein n=1 Tax=Laccaria bicolor (strain S238N-H82 / ATCC MYA-4686) TaxID=486041 RepID=B0DK70_LACBS|nr:uncharacterized protein LACBIDRAFT_303735 [Laccaria bicolor S238N-H82]EDR05018.1 predicted protein [Laccaria bicolor S238N-H82]|eukprot:XP_001884408.1 predicted protein [Laccaria bicolor S238N-H82]